MMLTAPPPGYTVPSFAQAPVNQLNKPGQQALAAAAQRMMGGMSSAMPGLSGNPLGQQNNTAMLMQLLKGGINR